MLSCVQGVSPPVDTLFTQWSNFYSLVFFFFFLLLFFSPLFFTPPPRKTWLISYDIDRLDDLCVLRHLVKKTKQNSRFVFSLSCATFSVVNWKKKGLALSLSRSHFAQSFNLLLLLYLSRPLLPALELPPIHHSKQMIYTHTHVNRKQYTNGWGGGRKKNEETKTKGVHGIV